ncbi:MAG: metallophosphoesterase [Erysipelotrichaceae bacterium]|nr:metallophosphoesterase [Erysipelotrichaceae bacterium]
MKKVFILLFCLCLLCGCNTNTSKNVKPAGSDLKIMVATDMHFLASECHDGGETSQAIYNVRDGKMVEYGKEIIMAFVDACIEENADAVLLTGDLTYNGERASHEELAMLLQPLSEANIDVLIMPGNHDIRNPNAYSFEGDEAFYVNTVEAEDFETIYENYGFKDAYKRDEHSLSYLYKLSEDIWFMVLDVNGYEWNSMFGLNSEGKIKQETLKWAEECFKLASRKGATILTATHHSLLKNEYLHSEDYRITYNANQFMQLMAKYGSLVNFSGHIHAQSIVKNEVDTVSLFDITTESLVVAENNYGVVTISDSNLVYEAKSLDVDGWAKKQGITDENLLNFHQYAWQHYYDVSYNLFLGNYDNLEVNQKVKEDIASLFAYLNPYYFSGRMDEVASQITEHPGYVALQKNSDVFSTNYLESMLAERDCLQRKIEITDIRK